MYQKQKVGYSLAQRNHRWRQRGPPLGLLVEKVDVAELAKPAKRYRSTAQVTNCELVASYNWLDKKQPTVMIPGAPPRWTPLAEPQELKEDGGVYYRDKNAARYPAHPMEPATRAVLTMHPEPLTKPVDVVACGSTIGSLLHFVRGNERPFRMLVEVVGGVVHLIRRENSPTETIPNVKGFGHTFPETYTTWDASVRQSTSHQRVLRYDFAGLGCIVRHEGDGYLEDKLGPSSNRVPSSDDEQDSIDALAKGLDASGITSKTSIHSSKLHLLSGGFPVPQTAVFDLKTRSILRRDKDFLGEELPRLWVAQIPNFILAYHERGTFTEIDVIDVSDKVKAWEASMNRELSQLAALLHRIVGLARASQDGRLEVSRQALTTLEVRKQCAGVSPVFSADMMATWKAWLAADAASEAVNDEDSSIEGDSDSNDDSDDGNLAWGEGDGDYTACSEKCSYCGRCTY
ncbi:hypothetical protein CDEST_15096 [Colletotrichum destructivum]|uniref:Geranylgeranyl pyrophosphate synthetase n=1 Tax=Colletotrichum destructivum TaxID=34406 RepID=A0AAX4J3I6_9PEZI|nr:hypothetical protein CDEST_15096 [Colletotrichum destructivum]